MSASLFLALYAIYGITTAIDGDLVDADSIASEQWVDDDGISWKVANEGIDGNDYEWDDVDKDILSRKYKMLEANKATNNAEEIMEEDNILHDEDGDNEQEMEGDLEENYGDLEERDGDLEEIEGRLEMNQYETREYDDKWDNDEEWDEISTLYSAEGDVIRRKCMHIWRGKLCLCQFLGWIDNDYIDDRKYHCIYHENGESDDEEHREYEEGEREKQEHENEEHEHGEYENIPVHHIQIHHFHHVASSDESYERRQPQQIHIEHIHNPHQIVIGHSGNHHGHQFEIEGHLKDTRKVEARALNNDYQDEIQEDFEHDDENEMEDDFEDEIQDDFEDDDENEVEDYLDDDVEDEMEEDEEFENYLDNALEELYNKAFLKGYRAGIKTASKGKQKYKMQAKHYYN